MARGSRRLGLAVAAVLLAPAALELRVRRPRQPLSDAWRTLPIEPRASTRLGISFRSPQVDAMGLDGPSTLDKLLARPFQLIRLGAYWNRFEPRPGTFDPHELDWQVEGAEKSGKQVVIAVGALKTFGYPELFVPAHRFERPLPEGKMLGPAEYPSLLAAATEHVARVVERYKSHPAVVAWQVEHEAVDPLGFEHSWRLSTAFVKQEVEAVRLADPSRPVLLNGYLPASSLAGLSQWWRTRDQGDSLALAQGIADVVGVDYYPRHALAGLGGTTVYLDAGLSVWDAWARARVLGWARDSGRPLMVTEGQAEPWEAVTAPPNPRDSAAYSCPPERLIEIYNRWLRSARKAGTLLDGYLFWGAEYWILRQQSGDSRYLQAFDRILEGA